ncbi:MAG: siderophore-interacting protein [Acidimicrobiia bacterium]|nr:siderophore-interacting protein [Acidimicrobiia bacterium]
MSDRLERIKALRREPPPFRRVDVARVEDLTPHLRRLTFAGDDLEGLEIDEPAASVRLLLPSTGTTELVVPEWSGNEFLLPSGDRPLIRTFTPRYLRDDPPELDLDIVLHGAEGASGWARSAEPGDPAAVSGPGRGYTVDPGSDPLVLVGDETALPAIAQLLEQVPDAVPVVVHVEIRHPDARLDLPDHPEAAVTWHDLADGDPPGTAMLAALEGQDLGENARVWAAGEAAGMQQIRTHLKERGVDRSRTTVRGYWKHGRPGPG